MHWRKLVNESCSLAVVRPAMEKGESRSPEVATLSQAREGGGYKERRLSVGLQKYRRQASASVALVVVDREILMA